MSEKRLILVVDDSASARRSLCALLAEEGYATAEAADALEATRYLEANPSPAVVLLDLIMPVHDGWSFLEWRRGHQTASRVPVIVLTGARAAEDSVRLARGTT